MNKSFDKSNFPIQGSKDDDSNFVETSENEVSNVLDLLESGLHQRKAIGTLCNSNIPGQSFVLSVGEDELPQALSSFGKGHSINVLENLFQSRVPDDIPELSVSEAELGFALECFSLGLPRKKIEDLFQVKIPKGAKIFEIGGNSDSLYEEGSPEDKVAHEKSLDRLRIFIDNLAKGRTGFLDKKIINNVFEVGVVLRNNSHILKDIEAEISYLASGGIFSEIKLNKKRVSMIIKALEEEGYYVNIDDNSVSTFIKNICESILREDRK